VARRAFPAMTPMHPTLVRESFHRPGWSTRKNTTAGECSRSKTASASGSSHGLVATTRCGSPRSQAAIAELPARTLILDGEICAFDANLISHIYLLDAAPEEPAAPPVFIAFDCIYKRGRDLRDRPLSYRRRALEDVIGDGHHVYAVRRLHAHGLDAWVEVKQRGYEGWSRSARSRPIVPARLETG
jgi:hypothetical protein